MGLIFSHPDFGRPVWHNFFTKISNNSTKQQASAQLISSAASQNELNTENKHKLLLNNFLDKLLLNHFLDKLLLNHFSDKLFFQQAEALSNMVFVISHIVT
jgi:hypothetical protein